MALDDITLNDGQGTPVAHTFEYTGTQNNRVIRTDMSAPLEEPLTLTVAHSDTKIAGASAKSHLVRFDKTKLDADGVTGHKANFRFMFDCPNAILTDALAEDFAAFGRNFCTAENIKALARGSVY